MNNNVAPHCPTDACRSELPGILHPLPGSGQPEFPAVRCWKDRKLFSSQSGSHCDKIFNWTYKVCRNVTL
eukprot:m.459645 g.459645  ORF g.459645 m.459645 type:complete len:70 (-) comp21798_c0_seq1:101-310(-)